MEILGIIPARGGSKGVPGKNIKRLGGFPLIVYTFEAVAASQYLTRTVLTTDREEIAELGRQYSIEVPFIRPAALSGDHAAAVGYIEHCLDFLQTNQDYIPDIIVLLQPTSPFREAGDIDHCVEMLRSSDADSIVSVTQLPVKYHPDWQFVVSQEGYLRPFTEIDWDSIIPSRQKLESTYIRNGAIYAFRYESFQRAKNIFGCKVLAYVMPPERSVNIDDMDDWAQAESCLKNRSARDLV
ncbi:MAG: acylneuraminate cytidylyltransferase family protein [Gammaproteobacteria bacterium]|jgi:CMP-N-acetylneuraminic acid synthetase